MTTHDRLGGLGYCKRLLCMHATILLIMCPTITTTTTITDIIAIRSTCGRDVGENEINNVRHTT